MQMVFYVWYIFILAMQLTVNRFLEKLSTLEKKHLILSLSNYFISWQWHCKNERLFCWTKLLLKRFYLTWQLSGRRRSTICPLQSQVLIIKSRIRRCRRWKLIRLVRRMSRLHHRAGAVQATLLLDLWLTRWLRWRSLKISTVRSKVVVALQI